MTWTPGVIYSLRHELYSDPCSPDQSQG